MQILMINNFGGGFADTMEADDGITVGDFFAKNFPDQNPEGFLIRVNRKTVTSSHVLQPDDSVSITPTKIQGAM